MMGVLFSLLDAMVGYADTAPVDDSFGFEIISWDKFIFKTIIYAVIGLSVGVTIQFVVKRLAFNIKNRHI